MIEMQTVASGNIAAVGYDAGTSTLRVQFHGGKTADYYEVPRGTYDAFVASSSPGSFFSSQIRARFAWSYV